jgi:ferritin-like metal-binding protein YciE
MVFDLYQASGGQPMGDNEQNRMEVILEDINGKFDLVLEGHATLEQMICNHQTETRQDKRELQALIKTSHDSLDAKINDVATSLSAEIQSVGEKVDGHEARITVLERKVA